MLAGQLIAGGVLSTTVTTCVSSAKLPLLSVALYVIVVVPTGKTFPEGTPMRVTTTPGQLSLAVAVPSVVSRLATVTPHDDAPGPVNSVTSFGAVIVGGIAGSSVTVTVCVAVEVRPDEFVAVYVIIVVPVGKTKLSHV
jgi:hypothetical protein